MPAPLPPSRPSAFLRSAAAERFRGTIAENCARFRLVGAGYASMPREQNGHFCIETARHLAGPLRALLDPRVEIVFIIGATQCLKSVVGDIWFIYLAEHTQDSVLALFEDDPKAKDYATTRCMPSLREHPVVAAMIQETVEATDRFQVTTTEIKLAGGRKLKICGLNDGNVSSLSWRFIWVSEAWQHKSDGLLRKAIRRADRYAVGLRRRKILIESQAGREDEDLEVETRAAVWAPLTWACPYCGGRQSWECDHEYGLLRPAEFVPRKPEGGLPLPEGQELWLPPKAGSYAGMKWPPAEVLREGKPVGLTIAERAEQARWECYWCGTQIADTPELRRRIADSYEQEYETGDRGGTGPYQKISPRVVAFRIPREGNMTNSFASGVASYLSAKESGNDVLLADWYMSERAVFHSAKLGKTTAPLVEQSALDPKLTIPNEAFRSLAVDCQKDMVASLQAGRDMTGHFWWIAEATDKAGNVVQLGRGYATSWGQLFDKGGIRERFRIPTRNVLIDAGNWRTIVAEQAARYRTLERSLDDPSKRSWATWKLLVGDDGRGAKWPDGVWRAYWPPETMLVEVMDPDATWHKIKVPVYRWSNFSVKSVLYKMRTGAPGHPKLTPCHWSQLDPVTQAKEKQRNLAYQDQLDGLALGEDNKGRPKFIELHPEQHYNDCHCMGIVLRMMSGKVRGETAPGDSEAQEVNG